MRRYFLPDGTELENVHDPVLCEHRECVIHNPTGHHMSDWPLVWRDDRAMFERTCEHGIGHPDPDQHQYWGEIGLQIMAVHTCDACCWEEKE